MAIYTNLPLYKASYALMLEVNRLLPNVPRDCRYTIGQDLRRQLMDIILYIYRANRSWQKVEHINKMRETLLEAQVNIRLMCDMKYISENQYLLLAAQTSDMSKQMAAWGKSVVKKQGEEHGASQ